MAAAASKASSMLHIILQIPRSCPSQHPPPPPPRLAPSFRTLSGRSTDDRTRRVVVAAVIVRQSLRPTITRGSMAGEQVVSAGGVVAGVL